MDHRIKRWICGALALALTASMLLHAPAAEVTALQYTGSGPYMSGKYYTKLRQVSLTGDPRTDIVAIARSQVGYQEGGSNNQLSGEVYGGVNHTEYGSWYGTQDMWCAMFVSWCADLAGVSQQTVPPHCYTPEGLNWFAERGLAYSREEVHAKKYTPRPGDLIYFKTSRNAKSTNHVGLVTGYSNGRVYTIEGNIGAAGFTTNGGMVAQLSYPITNTYIVYICSPNYTEGGTNVLPDARERTAQRELESLRNALISLETGEGSGYDRITPMGARSIAIGCGQWYGARAKKLLEEICREESGLEVPADLTCLTQADEAAIRRALASDTGVRIQNAWLDQSLSEGMDCARSLGVTDPEALLLCAALYQLLGSAEVERIIVSAGEAPSRDTLLTAVECREPHLIRSCRMLVA